MPGDESHFVERVDDGALKLGHHLHIVNILDVVALHNRNLSVDHHVLRMEGAEDRSVEIDHFDIDIGKLVRVRNPDLAIGIGLWFLSSVEIRAMVIAQKDDVQILLA
jgi:hypothetical protein